MSSIGEPISAPEQFPLDDASRNRFAQSNPEDFDIKPIYGINRSDRSACWIMSRSSAAVSESSATNRPSAKGRDDGIGRAGPVGVASLCMGRKRGVSVEGQVSRSTSQTLERGLMVLRVIIASDGPVSTGEAAAAVGLSKSTTYRFLRTLEAQGLIRMTKKGGFEPSIGLSLLGQAATRPLVSAAAPQLRRLADRLNLTAYVAVAERDEVVAVCVEEPRSPQLLAYRPSIRHKLGPGAPSTALLAGRAARSGDSAALQAARRTGYAVSVGEVSPGLTAVASPIVIEGIGCVGVVAVVLMRVDEDTDSIGEMVKFAAQEIAREMT